MFIVPFSKSRDGRVAARSAKEQNFSTINRKYENEARPKIPWNLNPRNGEGYLSNSRFFTIRNCSQLVDLLALDLHHLDFASFPDRQSDFHEIIDLRPVIVWFP